MDDFIAIHNNKMLFGKRFSIVGILLAVIGIFFAVLKFDLQTKEPKPKASHKIALNLSSLFQKRVEVSVNKISSPEDPEIIQSFLQKKRNYEMAAYLFGGISFCFGAIAWLRHEPRRWMALSIVLSLAAVAHEQVLWAIGVAVILLILGGLH